MVGYGTLTELFGGRVSHYKRRGVKKDDIQQTGARTSISFVSRQPQDFDDRGGGDVRVKTLDAR